MMWKYALVLTLITSNLWAQDQLALRLNEQGLLKILRMAVNYNTATRGANNIVVPRNLYKFTLPQSQLNSNPIIPIVNEISNLNLNADLDFYLNTSDINISGDVDARSLRATIFNSNSRGFDIRLNINLPRISVSAPSLSLCEDKAQNANRCGDGLKASIEGVRISTNSRPVALNAVLRLRTDGNVARVRVISVDSNLESNSAPNVNISINTVTVPPISIVINGQSTQLDTSRLRDEILNRRTFLGKKLLAFVGDFIASDLAEMLNVYLINQQVTTSYLVYRRDVPTTFNEFLVDMPVMAQDNTFVRPPLNIPRQQPNPITLMMAQIADVIRHAQIDLSLSRIATPANKDIELAGIINFVLNNHRLQVNNRLSNNNRTLPSLNLASHNNSDVTLAISEPLINGALDLVNSTGLFQELFDQFARVRGFSIRNVKLHFTNGRNIVAIVNSSINLREVQADSISSWFKNRIAAFLERNNNNSVIYFPIEVQFIPVVRQLNNGGVRLDLQVLSPFNQNNRLINNFNYPSNISAMTEAVREGVMDELKTSLQEHTNKTYQINLSQFLNRSGVEFLPKMISVNQAAYLLINLDIVNINFDSKNPNRR